MAVRPSQMREETKARHERDTRLEVWLPWGAGAAVLVIAVIVTAVFATRSERSVMADFLLMVLMLCPMALCAFPLMLGLIIAAVGLGRVHDWTQVKLGGLVALSEQTNDRIDRLSARLGRAGVTFGTNVAPAEYLIGRVFEPGRFHDGTEVDDEHPPTRPTS